MAWRGTEDGFSFVEVLIATGLLAGLVISIGGLFIVGAWRVDSGRRSSQALAVARGIHEAMAGWGYSQLWRMFGFDGRSESYAVDTRACDACSSWQSTLAATLGPLAYATIRIDSVGGVAGTAVDFADASGRATTKAVRIRVSVHWIEPPGRARSLTLGTMRN